MSAHLPPTKFIQPRPRPGLAPRPRLTRKLEQGFQAGSRLMLISAPAGYGKTTAAVAWLASSAAPAAWVSLGAEDSDPARFFTALVAALQTIHPGLGAAALSLLELAEHPPAAVVVDELVADLVAISQPFVLALEDYNTIRSVYVHDALDTLITHAPDCLRLVIISREDPPLPLARLRARGQLTELRAADLRFTPAETHDFLVAAMGLHLTPQILEQLDKRVEGWAAGLQLAGLALQSEQDPAAWVDSFGGGHRYVIEYLLDEVLQRQPPELRDFLQRTAILERFNAGLCQALLEPGLDARGMIDRLERANLFLTPLDSNREWYRYHRLFSDVLRAGLDEETEAGLHARAAAWFETHGFVDEAVNHFLIAGQTAPAARIIRAAAGDRLRRGEMRTLLRWIEALPLADVLAMPDLAALQALGQVFTGQADRSVRLLEKLEDRPPAPGLARALAVRAWMMTDRDRGADVVATARRALDELEPEDDAFFRILAMMALGTGYTWAEDLLAATPAFRQAHELAERVGHPFGSLAALTSLLFNLLETGQMPAAQALGERAMARYRDPRGRPLPLLGLVYVPMSMLHLERCEFEPAQALAAHGLELSQKLFSSATLGGDAEQVLIETTFITGDHAAAFEKLEAMYAYALAHHLVYQTNRAVLLAADLRLRLGDAAAARRELERLAEPVRQGQPLPVVTYHLVWARLLLNESQPAEALRRLEEMEPLLRSRGYLARQTQVLTLRAGCLRALGRQAEAVSALQEAVRLAAPGGHLRSVYRFAAEVVDLLPAARSAAPGFVDRVAGLLGGSAKKEAAPPTAQPGPLSEQELKVLRLLAAGRSNQEVAEMLYISTGTAKWHVHNVLQKLGAANRAQAATLAREQGLI